MLWRLPACRFVSRATGWKMFVFVNVWVEESNEGKMGESLLHCTPLPCCIQVSWHRKQIVEQNSQWMGEREKKKGQKFSHWSIIKTSRRGPPTLKGERRRRKKRALVLTDSFHFCRYTLEIKKIKLASKWWRPPSSQRFFFESLHSAAQRSTERCPLLQLASREIITIPHSTIDIVEVRYFHLFGLPSKE